MPVLQELPDPADSKDGVNVDVYFSSDILKQAL